jgi:hypothetical protein
MTKRRRRLKPLRELREQENVTLRSAAANLIHGAENQTSS